MVGMRLPNSSISTLFPCLAKYHVILQPANPPPMMTFA